MLHKSKETFGFSIICDPNRFTHLQNRYNPIKSKLINATFRGEQNPYSHINQTERIAVLRDIANLFGNKSTYFGGQIIQDAVYNPFAFRRGYYQRIDDRTCVVTPLFSLTPEQVNGWHSFLHSVQFSLHMRKSIAQAIGNFHFPEVHNTPYGNNQLITDLENARRSIVRRLLPDITDTEAELALGSKYTSQVVMSEATLNSFVI